MNEQLSKLFLGLDLTSSPQKMVQKSPLKFEYGVNKTISWGKPSDDTGNFVTEFDQHQLINTKIKKGYITIIPKAQSVSSYDFTINERIWFHNKDDMQKEYNHLCASFEKLGYKIKSTIIQDENFETKSENTEILMEDNLRKSSLLIGYFLPTSTEKDQEYFLGLVYTNF